MQFHSLKLLLKSHSRITCNIFMPSISLKPVLTELKITSKMSTSHRAYKKFHESVSGTSSRTKGPSLPDLNKVRNFFDTIKRASVAFWDIFSAF